MFFFSVYCVNCLWQLSLCGYTPSKYHYLQLRLIVDSRHTLTTVHTCETWRFYYTYFPILFLYWLNSIIFVKMLFRDGLKNLERTSGLMHLLQKIVPLWSLAGFPFISNLSFFCSMTGTPLNHIFLDLCLMSRRTSMIYKIQSHRAFCLYPWFHLVNFFFFSDLLSD